MLLEPTSGSPAAFGLKWSAETSALDPAVAERLPGIARRIGRCFHVALPVGHLLPLQGQALRVGDHGFGQLHI